LRKIDMQRLMDALTELEEASVVTIQPVRLEPESEPVPGVY
jgi:hypothetical protein